MTEVKTVRAAKERRIVAPDGSAVPAQFQVNAADPYWARMLREGDLELVTADDTAKAAPTPSVATAAVQKKDGAP